MSDTARPVVRPVTREDRERWQELFLAYGVFYEENFPPEVVEGVWAWLMEENHPLRCFVAEVDGQVQGFAHLRFQHDTFTAGAGWFLDDLFTHPEARGGGVATALISACLARAHRRRHRRRVRRRVRHRVQHVVLRRRRRPKSSEPSPRRRVVASTTSGMDRFVRFLSRHFCALWCELRAQCRRMRRVRGDDGCREGDAVARYNMFYVTAASFARMRAHRACGDRECHGDGEKTTVRHCATRAWPNWAKATRAGSSTSARMVRM